MSTPALKKGWMKKERRGGALKNWNKRWFVLEAGIIKYYEKELAQPPFGDSLKGELSLLSAVIDQVKGKCTDKQIYITSGSGDKDQLLMECETVEDANGWSVAINEHIRFMNPSSTATAIAEAKAKAAQANAERETKKDTTQQATVTTGTSAARSAPLDEELMKALGLEHEAMMESEGKLVSSNFKLILDSLVDDSVSDITKKAIAEGLNNWSAMIDPATREKAYKAHYQQVYAVISTIARTADDPAAKGEDYEGLQGAATSLTAAMVTAGLMDQSQALICLFAPKAWEVLEEILDSGLGLKDAGGFVKVSAPTVRTENACNLANTLPYTGTVRIPHAMKIVSRVLLDSDGTYPASLKSALQTRASMLVNVNKECMKDCGNEIMALVAMGGNDNLLSAFSMVPELYTNNPECLDNNIPVLLKQNYMTVASVFNNVSGRNPGVLRPYLREFVTQLKQAPMMVTLTLMILKNIAGEAPEDVYPTLDEILATCSGQPHVDSMLPGVIGNCGKAKTPANAADHVLLKLVAGLKACSDTTFKSIWLNEINNICGFLSDRKVLDPHMSVISANKSASDVIVKSIEDFHAGRSLAVVTARVDDLEVRVNELNTKVAESCKNYEDVIAYVDKNIRDVKDFIGDVVKKLPIPKRLEVVGTVRKALVLHFECAHTGYEFPITSHEWSKWLKMGFSLAKAGKAVIDIGMGNPLALVATGVDAVKGIYEAYKTNDDDEFNTYITNPFLTSTEQDGLINKLKRSGVL